MGEKKLASNLVTFVTLFNLGEYLGNQFLISAYVKLTVTDRNPNFKEVLQILFQFLYPVENSTFLIEPYIFIKLLIIENF